MSMALYDKKAFNATNNTHALSTGVFTGLDYGTGLLHLALIFLVKRFHPYL